MRRATRTDSNQSAVVNLHTRVTIRVHGIPAPGGSKKAFAHPATGKIIVTDDGGKRTADWKKLVKQSGKAWYRGKPFTGPIEVECELFVPRPKSHYGKGRNAAVLAKHAPEFPTVKPDATKLWRSTEDALTGVLWDDDAQIVTQLVSKRYASEAYPPGAIVRVCQIEPMEIAG